MTTTTQPQTPSEPQSLPMLEADVFLADAGLETSLIFDDGLDIPDFAAFLLLAEPTGRAALRRYYERYAAIAAAHGVGIVLDTPTWRASTDWGARHGYDADALTQVIRDSVTSVAGSGARPTRRPRRRCWCRGCHRPAGRRLPGRPT